MTFTEECITIGLCALASVLTRALPFLLLSEKKPTPPIVVTSVMCSPPLSSVCLSYTVSRIRASSEGRTVCRRLQALS